MTPSAENDERREEPEAGNMFERIVGIDWSGKGNEFAVAEWNKDDGRIRTLDFLTWKQERELDALKIILQLDANETLEEKLEAAKKIVLDCEREQLNDEDLIETTKRTARRERWNSLTEIKEIIEDPQWVENIRKEKEGIIGKCRKWKNNVKRVDYWEDSVAVLSMESPIEFHGSPCPRA